MALSPLKSPRVRLPLARGGKLRALAVTSNKRASVAADGSEAVGSLPGAFDRFLRSEMARFAKVIKNAGIKPGG